MKKGTKIEWLGIDTLIPYEHNAKEHTPKQIDNIKKSLTDYGWQKPCLITKDNVLIAGHGRVMAAKELGITEVPCIYADDLTEEQIKEYRHLDNLLSEGGYIESELKYELQTVDLSGYDFSEIGLNLEDTEIDTTIEEYAAPELPNLDIHQQLVWVKNVFTLSRSDYQWRHEVCYYGWKGGAAHYFKDERNHSTVFEDKVDFDKIKKADAIKLLKDIYESGISTTVIHEDKPLANVLHPTMKPINLLARQIRNSTKPNENVLDPFGGSGSTLIACEQLERNCYMVELDPYYCDVIIKRWEDFTGQKAVKL